MMAAIAGDADDASPARCRILVFTKYPHPGFAKTRLIPAVGAASAADISRKLTERCMRTVRAHCRSAGSETVVYYATRGGGDESAIMDAWLAPPGRGDPTRFAAQGEGDLGDRLAAAFQASFSEMSVIGARRKVLVVGVDIPELSATVLEAAFGALDTHDTVVGPAADGGFYLLGMRAPADGVFCNVRWGSDAVFEETERNIASLGLSMCVLKMLRDVDLPEDLPYYEHVCGERAAASP
jgi:uncharacterized protein